jgi:SAM-dependent methyltransferase
LDNELLQLLWCPGCGGDLTLESGRTEERNEGFLECKRCVVSYPVVAGIPRFVKSDDYLRNFAMEWTVHSRTAYDSYIGEPVSEHMFKTRLGYEAADVEGKLVLDAGCGSGRLTDLVRRYGGRVVGLDYTIAIDQAAKNLLPDERVKLVQGDILALPFKAGRFDIVFSNGVIHHTPNPPRAFQLLSKLVKPGGHISVWVYPDEGILGRIPNRTGALYRLLSKRLPLNVTYKLSKAIQNRITFPASMYEDFFDVGSSFKRGYRNPRQAIYLLFPFLSMAPYRDWRIMDTFDFLSPKYKFAYSYAQVASWFRDNGLVDVEMMPFPVGVKGRKSLAA